MVQQELYDFKFDWRYMVRGLTIDKKRGNILKIDRHKYVKIAYHGFRRLDRAERIAIYNAVQSLPPYYLYHPDSSTQRVGTWSARLAWLWRCAISFSMNSLL
jgi:5' nucleotidase family